MRGLNYGTSTGELLIDGTSLHCPAWVATDLTPLWLPGEVRGSDRLLPGVVGVKPYRRRLTVTSVDLPMIVTGHVQPDGTLNEDGWAGLQENLAQLSSWVTDSPADDGTWPAELIMPDGSSRTADVHVLALRLGELGIGATLASIELSIPAGRFG
jgi:hypothetical protein